MIADPPRVWPLAAAANSPIQSFLRQWSDSVQQAGPSYWTKEQVLAFMTERGFSDEELAEVRALPPDTRFWPDWS